MIRMEIKTRVLPADEAGVAEAAQLLRQGQLVALPTETVYGIAADARNGAAVRDIFVAKGRPQDNPLIVHVTGPEMLPGLVSEVPERAQLLMAAFCPGPLTIIMPRGPEVADECCAGLDTVGIRMPSHPVARAVIQQSGCAFAAPSANLSGKPSPTNAQDVFTDMDGRLPLILDGGECDLGDTVAVIDSSRSPEWRLKARLVKRVRTFGDTVICRVTIGTVQPVDYAVTSSLAADVAALQDDVAGIDGNMSVATSTVYVQDTVTEAIDELDELADLDF